MNSHRPSRIQVDLPASVVIVFSGIAVLAVVDAYLWIRAFVNALVAAGSGTVVVVVVSGIIGLGITALVVLLIAMGYMIAPLAVLAFSLWHAAALLYGVDPISIGTVIVSVIVAVVIWFPSARTFGAQRRNVRMGRKVAAPPPA